MDKEKWNKIKLEIAQWMLWLGLAAIAYFFYMLYADGKWNPDLGARLVIFGVLSTGIGGSILFNNS